MTLSTQIPRRISAAVLALPLAWTPAPPAGAEDALRGAKDIEARLIVGSGDRSGNTRGFVVEGEIAPSAVPPAGRNRLTLPALRFEYDSDRLTPAARTQARELRAALMAPALAALSFSIQGHTDSAGTGAYNRGLSLRRALAVKRALTAETGVAAHRLIAVGLGENFPVPGLDGRDGRNRRVEIVNLGAVAPPAAAPPPTGEEPARRALLIGIDDYMHVSRLEGPVADALAMESFVVETLGYARRDVRLLTNAEATREGILSAIRDWLIVGAGPGGEAFLYFSGHGFQQPDRDGDEDDQLDETLIAVDARVELNDDGGVRGVRGAISDDEISALLGRMAEQRVYAIVDACHSGTSTRSFDDSWPYVKTPRLPDGTPIVMASRGFDVEGIAPPPRHAPAEIKDAALEGQPGLTVWAAVGAWQKALIDTEAKDDGGAGSVFTRRFLQGVRDGRADANRDGVVTAGELHAWISRESEAYCARHSELCPEGLTPQLDAPPAQIAQAAFGKSPPALRNAALAKDLLLRPADRAAPGESAGGDVRLRVDGAAHAGGRADPRLALGETYGFTVESKSGGELVLLDIDAAGALTQIFPNDFSTVAGVSNRIPAGGAIALPGENTQFRFRAAPPLGAGLLIAVVSDGSAQLASLAARHKDLSVVGRPEAYLVEIGEALRRPSAGGRNPGWRAATLAYEIVAPRGADSQ